MQMNYEAEQLSMFGPDTWYGKMSPEPSPAAHQKEKISASYWKRSLELKAVPFLSLDLTPGRGNLLGESYWELISPWRGGASMLNTGVSPREERGSSLSRILQDHPPKRYYLTWKACQGILRRASERGKELPEKLKRALEIQAGLIPPDGRPTELEAYHINQRDEGIDLHGVPGALMATSNMQMQTFVTQPDKGAVIAFAANQRDEMPIFGRQRVDVFQSNEVVITQSARQHKDVTDLVMDVAGLDCRNARENGDLCGTLQHGSSGTSLNSIHPIRNGQLIRRLTPLECERLQGFPDGWTDIPGASDSARYKALGNSVAIPCVEYVLHGIALVLRAGGNEKSA